MTSPIRYPFPDALDEHEAQFDDDEIIRLTGRDMLDRLAVPVETYPPQPAWKEPMFWEAVLGLLAIALVAGSLIFSAVIVVLGVAALIGV